MSQVYGSRAPVFSLVGREAQPTSIRAKALVFVDPLSQGILRYLERVSPSDAPVLIIGETGTGKELVARQVHQLSGRTGPFVAVNCGAISEQLADSELFGHEPGAFTGATGRREGWFEAANGGTLFLDEIGDLPLSLQVKLLRVLQEREVVRLGSRRSIPVDIRLVAATNIDLGDAVNAGHFRLDLFYRLNIAQLRLPALRERTGDILPLADHFLDVYRQRLNLPPLSLSLSARRALERYSWPGNIRELENVIHFALLVAPAHEIGVEHLKLTGGVLAGSPVLGGARETSPRERIAQALQQLLDAPGQTLFNDLEKLIVDEAFRHSHSNQVRAAAQLGISRNVLRTLLKKHGHLGGAAEAGGPDDDGRPDAYGQPYAVS
ncbi:sigma-54-dependent Fis family transcriptional regulator [Solimonas sp. K1W22B-7]|uniref:sigma-54 interaction domain-containing protein n=1 Tax=Solimonas sp. K1W22B-7 TaxID=2303331 RepID=UPI000E337B53|nr:sigma-54 dependent transcriptional regulator [Solimonas sp. K1W22B-7]AXQ28481.1 sigma-54-dependent Fis family transcriptional regulator [Solimonas sp. K1W22B-7]